MSLLSNLTVAFVPGSFFRPSLYDDLIERLTDLGYHCTTIVLGSVDCQRPREATVNSDSVLIRTELETLIGEGKEILLVLHSYGSIPGSGAASGLSKVTRQEKGLAGGIIGLVCISSILALEGETCLQNMGEEEPSWSVYNPESGNTDIALDIVPVLFNDLSSEAVEKARMSLGTQAGAVYVTPAPVPAWTEYGFVGRLAYIRCSQDGCVFLRLQKDMVEKSGAQWEVIDFDSGHCPMLSMTALLAGTVAQFAVKVLSIRD